MHFFYMIIRVYLFVPRWRPVIGRFLVLWHSFNKFVLAKRLHEPAVFNRNHISQDGAGCERAQHLACPYLRYSKTALAFPSISVAGFSTFFSPVLSWVQVGVGVCVFVFCLLGVKCRPASIV